MHRSDEEAVVASRQSMAGTTRQEPRLRLSWSDIATFDQHASRQPSPRPREREHLAQTAMIAGNPRDHQAKYRNSCRVSTASPPMGSFVWRRWRRPSRLEWRYFSPALTRWLVEHYPQGVKDWNNMLCAISPVLAGKRRSTPVP
jgi:hypothetical protein